MENLNNKVNSFFSNIDALASLIFRLKVIKNRYESN
jgi:hypothetical protein